MSDESVVTNDDRISFHNDSSWTSSKRLAKRCAIAAVVAMVVANLLFDPTTDVQRFVGMGIFLVAWIPALIALGVLFCPSCSNYLPLYQPWFAFGFGNFCGRCGSRIGDPDEAATEAAEQSAPEASTSP